MRNEDQIFVSLKGDCNENKCEELKIYPDENSLIDEI